MEVTTPSGVHERRVKVKEGLQFLNYTIDGLKPIEATPYGYVPVFEGRSELGRRDIESATGYILAEAKTGFIVETYLHCMFEDEYSYRFHVRAGNLSFFDDMVATISLGKSVRFWGFYGSVPFFAAAILLVCLILVKRRQRTWCVHWKRRPVEDKKDEEETDDKSEDQNDLKRD